MDKELYSELAKPFAGEQPAGVDASTSTEFEAIEDELDRAQGLNFDAIYWENVRKNAFSILQKQSKDLRVVGYLTIALYEQEGIEGLTTGLQLFANMVNADYWEDIYPKRKKRQDKARAAAFEWAASRIEKIVRDFQIEGDSELPHLIRCADAYTEVNKALFERLGENAPVNTYVFERLKSLRQHAQMRLQELEQLNSARTDGDNQRQQKEKTSVTEQLKKGIKSVTDAIIPNPKAKPQKPQQEVVEIPQVLPANPIEVDIPSHQALSSISSDKIDKALGASRDTLLAVVKALRSVNSMDAWAFYLARTAQWMVLDELPASGVMPPNPKPEQFEALETMSKNKQHGALVEQGERLFSQGAIFSMKLHRLIANALEAQGQQMSAQMVKICTQALVHRLPAIVQTQFSDKSPFLDPLTQNWLNRADTSADGEIKTSQTGGTDVTNNNTPWAQAFNEALSLLSDGNFEEGIAIFGQGIATAKGMRERTYWQLAQARFCMQAEHLDIALAQLELLEHQLSETMLNEWEPQLRVEIITQLLQCHKMKTPEFTAEQKLALAPLYRELSLKAPVVALSIPIN